MSLQEARKLIRDIVEPSVYFMYDDWVFEPSASWDQRESDFKRQTSYKWEHKDFNLWTGQSIDDTYIAPPYIPDRGLINLSGKECDPLYWLLINVYNTKEIIDKQRYRDDVEYRNSVRKSASGAWQQLAKNLQFWNDLEEIIWNSKERQIHVDQCWFFGKIDDMYGHSWKEYKITYIDKDDGIIKTYPQLSSGLENSVPASTTTKVSSKKQSSDDTEPKNVTDKKKKKEETAGIIFWIFFIGAYVFTSADLLHSALGAFFIALATYIVIS